MPGKGDLEKVASELRSECGEAARPTSIFGEHYQLRSHRTEALTKSTGHVMCSRSIRRANVVDEASEDNGGMRWNWRARPTGPCRALQALVRNSELFPNVMESHWRLLSRRIRSNVGFKQIIPYRVSVP